jgi:hypothetical protein
MGKNVWKPVAPFRLLFGVGYLPIPRFIALAAVLLVSCGFCFGQVVGSSGSKTPPGCVKGPNNQDAINYRVVAVPGNPAKNEVNAWVEFTNPTANACAFVFCFMLDLDLPNVQMPNYDAAKDANNNWSCTLNGQKNSNPNFHYGCTEITVPAFAGRGQNGDPKRVVVFNDPKNPAKLKAPVQMAAPFKPTDLGVVYMDMLKDCPLAVKPGTNDPTCNLCTANVFLTPMAPQNHADWVNTWIGGRYFHLTQDGFLAANIGFMKGNWVTMALPDATFPATLSGTLTGAPPGTTFALAIPGSNTLTLTVGGDPRTCTGTDLPVTSPYNIAQGGNDMVMATVTAPSGQCGVLAEGR